MAIHPADTGASNPRLQCIACGQWKRLHGRDKQRNIVQRFYGGCNYGKGDHLFHVGADHDVCTECCDIVCRDIAIGRAAG